MDFAGNAAAFAAPVSGVGPKIKLVGGGAVLVGVLAALYFLVVRKAPRPVVGSAVPPAANVPVFAAPVAKPGRTATGTPSPFVTQEEAIASSAPDNTLASFAFESLVKQYHVPNAKAVLVAKPPGNPPYKLVNCADKGYAVRWSGRYLTALTPSKVVWTEEKQEPNSCWKTVAGSCGGDKYVMLRSQSNNLFLRADAASGALVCKDAPTNRTKSTFCWKLLPDSAQKQPCGCQYSYDLQKVVCTPCNVVQMPVGDASCSTVTAGYQAACCEKRGTAAASQDAFCSSSYWPEIVGRTLQEAMLYLKTRRPEFTLQPCPAPCTASAVPVPTPNTVLIPYDPRSNIVTAPARRLI